MKYWVYQYRCVRAQDWCLYQEPDNNVTSPATDLFCNLPPSVELNAVSTQTQVKLLLFTAQRRIQ